MNKTEDDNANLENLIGLNLYPHVSCAKQLEDDGSKVPHHAIHLQVEVEGLPKYYCCDARREDCPFAMVVKELNYCTYEERQ